MYADLIGNYKNQRIKSLQDNKVNEIDISNKTTSATGFGDFLAGTKEAEILAFQVEILRIIIAQNR